MRAAIVDAFDDADVSISAGRRNAFEIDITTPAGHDHSVWSGINKGPPRKLKWVEPTDVVASIRAILDKE